MALVQSAAVRRLQLPVAVAFIVQRVANDAAERYNCIARAHVEYSVHTQGSLKEQRRHTRPQQSSQRGLTSNS